MRAWVRDGPGCGRAAKILLSDSVTMRAAVKLALQVIIR